MRADLLSDWAADIYVDQARRLGYDFLPRYYELRAKVRQVTEDPFQPFPDPAALVVAARLLHNLLTSRREVPCAVGPTWSLVETYLLLHGHAIRAGDDEVAALLDSLRDESIDASVTFSILAKMVAPADR